MVTPDQHQASAVALRCVDGHAVRQRLAPGAAARRVDQLRRHHPTGQGRDPGLVRQNELARAGEQVDTLERIAVERVQAGVIELVVALWLLRSARGGPGRRGGGEDSGEPDGQEPRPTAGRRLLPGHPGQAPQARAGHDGQRSIEIDQVLRVERRGH